MNLTRVIKGSMVCLAVLGVCLPQPLLAVAQDGRSPVMLDVTLHKGPLGNVLLGQVQDPQGVAKANVPVVLYSGGRKLAETRTDRNGYFRFSNLHGGVYLVASAGGVGAYRVWTPGTAPPAARQGALVVADEDLVRGQYNLRRMKFWLSHPLVVGGIVATAVAIPVAIHNFGQDEGPASP